MIAMSTNLSFRSLLGAIRKEFVIALALAVLIIPAARSAPPDERTKALVDAAIAQERKGPERVRRLQSWETTNLLLNSKFEELESIINRIEQTSLNDPTLEFERYVVLGSFDRQNHNLLASLDQWVKLRPSAISYSARGSYLEGQAQALRGERLARETPALNFELMELAAKQAIHDLKKAISLNPNYIPAYTSLINASLISRDSEVDTFQLMSAINRLQPSNFYPRQAFLRTLQPRWGGSHEAMFQFAESAVSDAKHNPMLWILTGRVYLDITQYRQPNSPEQDIKDLTEGLKYGESNHLLEARGMAYWRNKNVPAAIADFSKCVANNPNENNPCKKHLSTLTAWQNRVRNSEQKSN